MKLEKAIEISDYLVKANDLGLGLDYLEAIKLLIEAGKYVLASRGIGAHYTPTQLIGETPADDSP